MEQYARVLVDVPGIDFLDYKVPEELFLAVGDIVIVPLRKKQVPGIVAAILPWSAVDRKKLRSVSLLKAGIPPLAAEWLRLTRFAANYYCRSWGEVALPAIPSFFRKKPGARYENSLARIRKTGEALPKGDEAAKPELNSEQKAAVDAILSESGFQAWLLFGVTGSGKTEVYLRVMESVLAANPENQVLLLVPEINLTPQLTKRVIDRFPGETVAALNSNLAKGERAASWLAAHEGRARILVGTRMAAFASMRRLALIIVDEEHDRSYKAGDGARYSARDVSVKRASLLGIPVVLGSATPSLESWSRAKEGGYRLLTLRKRALSPGAMPRLILADLRDDRDKGERLSRTAADEIDKNLERGEQTLIFLNRRGYSPVLMCPACGWTSDCPNCSAHMVFHKDSHCLVCHHCGRRTAVPERCPSCGAVGIVPVGAGTQRLEEEIAARWPGARTLRIDRDSFRTKRAAEQAFRRVHEGKVDILVGTQMVAKGHDFKKVTLSVILNIDPCLVSPDTRSREQGFSIMLQVAGRAGRAELPGRVVVETMFPNDRIFGFLAAQDFEGFADDQLRERFEDGSPPFVHQAFLYCEHDDLEQALLCLGSAAEAARKTRNAIPGGDAVVIYDPVPMPMVKVASKNRAQLLVECQSRKVLLPFLHKWIERLPCLPGASVVLEVDPMES